MTTWTGPHLREARGRLKHPDGTAWSQKDVADHIQAGLRTYAGWERGEATPQAHFQTRLNDLFADVAPPNKAAGDPAETRRRLTELLAEALTLVTQLDRQPPAVGQETRFAARARDPEEAPRVQWLSADAPAANREREVGGNQRDEAQ